MMSSIVEIVENLHGKRSDAVMLKAAIEDDLQPLYEGGKIPSAKLSELSDDYLTIAQALNTVHLGITVIIAKLRNIDG